ncbi:MAG: radical SAM protein [Deltaproteobacteria bacterium]|nr:MAG: radical SAM protein [Deltaproteobacteria bacterium]
MQANTYLKELNKCDLCEHRCGVNRLEEETGVCRITQPMVASATLHPAPPESYTVFMAGCNFKCLHCQNWTISQYPDNRYQQRGFIDPEALAEECVTHLNSFYGRRMRADRIFFSGGEPTIHLPYIEKVVEAARKLKPDTRVNFDTNGYMTQESLKRVLALTTSITYDLKAYRDEVHQALTGASSRPVLRNAAYIGTHAKDKLWEYRIVVIPQINESEVQPLTEFIAEMDPDLPVCFLAFRPNFTLENHPGASRRLMERCVEIAESAGLRRAYWSGHTGISGKVAVMTAKTERYYTSDAARLAASYALYAGCCEGKARNCSTCAANQGCRLKTYIPKRIT